MFSLFSTIKHELTEPQGASYFLLLHSISVLLLLFLAYAAFFPYKNTTKAVQADSQNHVDAVRPLFIYLPGAAMTLDKDFTIIDVNGFVTEGSGFYPHELKGKKCYVILGNGEICYGCLVQKALETGEPQYGCKFTYEKPGRAPQYGKQTVIPVKDQNDNITFVYEIFIDISLEVALERENAEMHINIVDAITCLIESRDPSTGTHSYNVQNISVAIGKNMGLNDKELKELSIAAILHDIGKIGTPESILNKPGRLTDCEFAIIQRHPQIGYDAIKHIKQLERVSEAILDHHEHYNGAGYPNGKKREEISMIARILAVADVFEALTSDRVYRKAMSTNQAIDIILEGKAQQFDPNVVDALMILIDHKRHSKAVNS